MSELAKENPVTAQEIFNSVKSKLKNPDKEVVTSNDAQVAFNEVMFDMASVDFESDAIDEAIVLVNNYFDVSISD